MIGKQSTPLPKQKAPIHDHCHTKDRLANITIPKLPRSIYGEATKNLQ